MSKKLSLLLIASLLALTIAGCSTTTQTVTVTQTSNITDTSTATSTSTLLYTITLAPTPSQTGTPTTLAGDLAATGANLYAANCAQTYCHAVAGDQAANGAFDGQPFNVSFGTSALSYFNNAANLFVFIKSFMHHPDTASFLTDDQYVQIIAYLLVQNGTLQNNSVFGLSNLASVQLTS
jgi:hypothetical protein